MLENLKAAAPVVADGLGRILSMSHRLEERMPEQLDYYLRFKRNVLPEGPDHFLGRFYYDTALAAPPHAFASLLTVVDSSHILFGTDYVFATEAAVPATIRGVRDYVGFTPEDVDAIGHGSALALFPSLASGARGGA